MDFDDAMRQYGIDKPDLRVPAFTDVADCFAPDELQGLAINKDLPVIALRIPHVGELSRKERDDIKPLFVSKGGARVFEDFKRIENKHPEAAAPARVDSLRSCRGPAERPHRDCAEGSTRRCPKRSCGSGRSRRRAQSKARRPCRRGLRRRRPTPPRLGAEVRRPA